jgi:hypothetical protein
MFVRSYVNERERRNFMIAVMGMRTTPTCKSRAKLDKGLRHLGRRP